MNNKGMLKMMSKLVLSSPVRGGGGSGGETAAAAGGGWEMRPGGMLVQQRLIDSSNQTFVVVPTIKVRVKYCASYHEITISSQATFGELKKMLARATGLNHQDQKLLYKEKERDSKAFLDQAGVKNGSKLVLIEDELSVERRYLESRKTAKMIKASKDIAAIRFDVDQLAKQVAAVEMEISSGKKVMEKVISNLTEMLMNQLIKLDGIAAEGDVKLQRRMQVKRVQKYIESLDTLKIRNCRIEKVEEHHSGQRQMAIPGQQGNCIERSSKQQPVVMTTNWETF